MYSNEENYSDQNNFFNGIDDWSAGEAVLEYSRTEEPEAGESVVAIKDGVCQVVTIDSELPSFESECLHVWGVISSVIH